MYTFEMLLPKLVPGLFPVVHMGCQQDSRICPQDAGLAPSRIPLHSGDSYLWGNERYMRGMTRTPRWFVNARPLLPALAAKVV